MASTNVSIVEGHFDPNIPQILPHDKMYNIQIGTKLFKISGASLSSDGPSYFTNYFIKKDSENNQNNNSESPRSYVSGSTSTSTSIFSGVLSSNFRQSNDILFIDRSPQIFSLIYQHLQGYFINIKDEVEYTMLIADAVYYNLPRLKALLKNSEYFYSRIGDRSFKFPKELLRRNGDNQNYFQVTTDSLYLDVENLILVKKLLRPPPHSYSFVPRSPVYFEMLLDLLNGCRIHLDDELRESLIQECKFYRFLNLEQRLIKCHVEYNPFLNTEEICLNLYKVVKRGLVVPNYSVLDDTTNTYILNIKTKLSDSGITIKHSDNNNNNNENVSYINSIQNYDVISDNHTVIPCTMQVLDIFEVSDNVNSNGNNNNDVSELKLVTREPSLKKPKLKDNAINHHLIKEPSTIVSNWNFVSYKRPFIDDYERVLNFQLNTKECSILFNKVDSKVYLNLTGNIAKKFESVFGSTLLKLKNVNLQDYKINYSTPEITTNNNVDSIRKHNFIRSDANLVIPACLDFANIVINDQSYLGNLNEYFNKIMENTLNLGNSTKFSKYAQEQRLYLSKSIWKLAIDSSSKSIVLLAVKLQAYTTLKVWGQQLEFL
ncbi:Mrx16p PWA37_001995 [Arxiozyma heterogenica]|uniref:BTB domain-containing protein n=1 Tax=Arxiozyma heterogenica TaxID=278026 RepID=A0AAN7WLV0_9SACH|nr:hypothetical protein RI543_001465 [Kazachstania heterogenica]